VNVKGAASRRFFLADGFDDDGEIDYALYGVTGMLSRFRVITNSMVIQFNE